MKNKRFGLILPVLAGLLLCSCSNPAGERHEGAPGPGNTLTIRFDGVAASRSIRPAPLSGDVSWFNISLTRSGFTTIEQTIAGTDASGTLTGIAAGDWLLDIAGYNPSAACIASHSQTVTISDGANAVPVVLVRKRTGGPDWGYGTMQVTLTVYSLPVPAAYCAVTLCSLPDLSPVDVASSLTVYDNESSDVFDILATLPSRDYLFQVSYEYGGLTWYLVDDPVVKIYDDAVSSAQLYKTAMTPAVLPAANGMAFTGAPADFAGKKFIYVVVDKDTADAVLLAGGSFTDILPASGGAFTLGPDGFGTEVPVDLIGLAEVPLVPGSSYYVSAMVDMNGNYSSLGAADILADYAYILPHDGDYVTASDNGFALYAADAANGSITLTPADFSQYSGGVFFVADAASGDASGSTPANACTLATAATGVAVLSLSGKQAEICLTENVNLSTGIGINGSAIIRSVIPGSAATIVVSGTYGGSYIDVGSGASLRLVNVTVDASSVTLLESSLVTVNTSGELELGEDATISNANSASNGGAVCLAGGSLILSGGTIAGCSAPKGGGIYVTSGGSLEISSASSVTGNAATSGSGGGVYIDAGSTLSDPEDLASSSVTGNTGPDAQADDIYDANARLYISVTFSGGGDPVFTTGDPGDLYADSYIEISVDGTFDSWEWRLDNAVIPGQTSSTCTFVPIAVNNDISTGTHTVALIVGLDGTYYSSTFDINLVE